MKNVHESQKAPEILKVAPKDLTPNKTQNPNLPHNTSLNSIKIKDLTFYNTL